MTECAVGFCRSSAEWQIWVNDDSGNRIVDEPRCAEHLFQLLRQHSDKDVPWPLWAPGASVPFHYIKASEALRLMGMEFGTG